jgi:transposase
MMEEVYPQSSGLDVHQKFVVACVMVANQRGRIKPERKRFETTTKGLTELAEWLAGYGIKQVAMESTGVYWKPVYNVLHQGFDVWIVNARHLAQVPGRKTDDTDATWITKLMQHGLLQPSFIPNEWQRDLRDMTRYRTRLHQEKSSAVNRLHKILEDGNIKISSVVSDIQGVSARAMLEALIENQLDAEQMADLALRRLRRKIPELVAALTGFIRPHHRFMLQEVLTHIDELNQRINSLSQRIAHLVAPYAQTIERLDEIVGVGPLTAEIILAEIGPVVEKWPTAGHLASWSCLCPGNNESGGKRRRSKRRKGQKWLVTTLVESAWAASRSKDTYLAAQFQRIRARRGENRAAIAVAHSILTIIYHLLKDPDKRFKELGGDYFVKRNKAHEKRRAVKTLTTLGFEVQLTSSAA